MNLNELSEEELRAISLQKIKRGPRQGCATAQALKAQKILAQRAGNPFHSSSHFERDHAIVKIF